MQQNVLLGDFHDNEKHAIFAEFFHQRARRCRRSRCFAAMLMPHAKPRGAAEEEEGGSRSGSAAPDFCLARILRGPPRKVYGSQ